MQNLVQSVVISVDDTTLRMQLLVRSGFVLGLLQESGEEEVLLELLLIHQVVTSAVFQSAAPMQHVSIHCSQGAASC